MIKDEFRPDVGKKFFVEHQIELEQGLRQVANALGYDQKLSHPAEFFQAFISGLWDPFQEVCETSNKQQAELTARIRALEKQLRQGMAPGTQDSFSQYSELLAARNTDALDYAFLVGYQCAFRFMLMGLCPGTMDFLKEGQQ